MPGPEGAGLTHRRLLYFGGQGGSMGGRRRSAAILAVSVVIGVAGCGSGSAGVFHPAGSLSAQPGQAAPAPTSAVQRFGGFTFPAGVSIDFASPAPADASQRAIIAGYQDYVLSMWAGVLTHGKNTTYAKQAEGNALTFVTRQVARYRSPGRTVRGTIRYSATKITNVYFGNGASVSSCVDAAAFHDVNAQTGAKVGPALPARPVRYLETVSEGRRSDGTWFVNRSVTYPAARAQGAMCR
jgi:phage gpG-like protein